MSVIKYYNWTLESEDYEVTSFQKQSMQKAVASSLLLVVGLNILSACMDTAQVIRTENYAVGSLAGHATLDHTQNTCFESAVTPAIIETVTEQVMFQSASVHDDSTVARPATFRTVTRQQIMQERRKIKFEILCRADMTPQLIASVQRALIARGYYKGTINGLVDARTKTAIQRFQSVRSLVQTSTLTLQTARILGLVAQPRDSF